MYMVPLMFMGMFMHVHACSCMLNSGCPTVDWADLPVINLSKAQAPAELANEVRNAITTKGSFYVIQHGYTENEVIHS